MAGWVLVLSRRCQLHRWLRYMGKQISGHRFLETSDSSRGCPIRAPKSGLQEEGFDPSSLLYMIPNQTSLARHVECNVPWY